MKSVAMIEFSDDSEVEGGDEDYEAPPPRSSGMRPRSNTTFPSSPFSPGFSSDIFSSAFKRRTTVMASVS